MEIAFAVYPLQFYNEGQKEKQMSLQLFSISSVAALLLPFLL
jgi:hypothetical protein